MTTESISDAPAGDATDEETNAILQLFQTWSETLRDGVVRNVVGLYGPGAVLVPTLSNTLATTPGMLTTYFERLIRVYKPRLTTLNSHNVRHFGTTAINSGIYTFDFENTGTFAQARYTFVYQRAGSGWLISAHHSSLLYSEIVAGKANVDPSF